MTMDAASVPRRRIGRYEVGRTLGTGRFAEVKFGRHVDNGTPVAIKIIKKDRFRRVDKLVKQEIATMKLINHPHVVKLLEVLASKQNVYIILEFVSGGELLDKIVEDEKLQEDEARRYFRQLICGIDYCHSRGVYHRDLKVHTPELEFPLDFPVEAQRLIVQLLDPNPHTRLTVQGIHENTWFQAGDPFDDLNMSNNQDLGNCDDRDMCFRNGHANTEDDEQGVPIQDSQPAFMNAFEIISMLSQGLDLSGLFILEEENICKEETKFTSRHPAREIITKISDFALQLGYQVRCKNFKVNMQSSRPGRKGFLCVATKVMGVGPSLFMVDIHKTSGDTFEYRDFQQKLAIGLKDIVWKSEADLAGGGR